MVELNATLIVELVLFLLFLAGCHFMIFKPVLRQIDTREDKIAGDIERAQREASEAAQLESEYTRQLAAARRAVAEEFRRARYTAQQDQDARVLAAKKEADANVSQAHREARSAVKAQRDELERLAPEVAETLAKKLGLGDLL